MNDNTNVNGKKCRICGEFKEYENFYKDKSRKDGFSNRCRLCDKEQCKQYQEENATKLKEKRLQHYEENKEKVLEAGRKSYKKKRDYYLQQFKEYQVNNSGKIKKRKKKHYEENKEEIMKKHKEYYEKNKEKLLEYHKKYREENRDTILLNLRIYHVQNKDTLKKKRAEWYRSEEGREKAYQNNLKRRSYKNHVRFYGVKRKNILDRDNWTCQKCGCKVHDRTSGDWNTPDKANIDHIIPISKGGHSEPSNLQVLCRTCNLSKHAKVEEQMEMNLNTI